MKFRKKPLTVEAAQYIPGQQLPEGVIETMALINGQGMRPVAIIQTLEGNMMVNPGDWVVTGQEHGERWPVRRDIFESTYTQVDVVVDLELIDGVYQVKP